MAHRSRRRSGGPSRRGSSHKCPAILGVMPEPTIVAMGGLTDGTLLDYVLGIAPGKRVLYVPTAGMEDPAGTVSWYERLHGRAEMRPLHFSPWPPANLRELVLGQDIVLVAGGNTANALAIWRAHGFDTVL